VAFSWLLRRLLPLRRERHFPDSGIQEDASHHSVGVVGDSSVDLGIPRVRHRSLVDRVRLKPKVQVVEVEERVGDE
jgi:hypothetical protein